MRCNNCGRVCSTAFMVTSPLVPGAISTFTRASLARANSSSLTGTSLTTTVYLSSCRNGAGSGTGGGSGTSSGISPDGPVSAATSRCPAEGGGASGVNCAHAARTVNKIKQQANRQVAAPYSKARPVPVRCPGRDGQSVTTQIQCNNPMMLRKFLHLLNNSPTGRSTVNYLMSGSIYPIAAYCKLKYITFQKKANPRVFHPHFVPWV